MHFQVDPHKIIRIHLVECDMSNPWTVHCFLFKLTSKAKLVQFNELVVLNEQSYLAYTRLIKYTRVLPQYMSKILLIPTFINTCFHNIFQTVLKPGCYFCSSNTYLLCKPKAWNFIPLLWVQQSCNILVQFLITVILFYLGEKL